MGAQLIISQNVKITNAHKHSSFPEATHLIHNEILNQTKKYQNMQTSQSIHGDPLQDKKLHVYPFSPRVIIHHNKALIQVKKTKEISSYLLHKASVGQRKLSQDDGTPTHFHMLSITQD